MMLSIRRQAAPIILVIAACTVMTVHYALTATGDAEVISDPSWALQRHANENDMPVGKLIHELSHNYADARRWPVTGVHVADLPAGEAGVREALEDLAEESSVNWYTLATFPLFGVACVIGLLALHSRRDFSKWRWALLAAGVLVFGLWFGGQTNPMESFVKAIKYLVGLEGRPADRALTLLAFTLLAIAGNKLICGWGCPLGSLQDVIHRFSPTKKWKPPFWLTNALRVLLLGFVLCFLFGWVFGIDKLVLYHYVNLFKVFNWTIPFPWWVLIFAFLLCLFWYRPYCHLICPFGLWSWVAEHFSLARVRVNTDLCVRCQKCVRECPTPAADARINSGGRTVGLPDCFACGACVEVCPTKAVVFDMPRDGYVSSLPPKQ